MVCVVGLVAACSSDDSGSSAGSATDGEDTTTTEEPTTTEAAAAELEVIAVSTDASRVTGGDVLLSVAGAEDEIEVTVDGVAADAEVGEPLADGSAPVLVTGLPEGESE